VPGQYARAMDDTAQRRQVRLRPIRREDLAMLEEWETNLLEDDPFNCFGFRDPRRREREWEEDGLLSTERGHLLVALTDGTAIGDVGYRAVRYSTVGGAWNIGASLLPEHRGQGYGTAAQAALAEHLFATTLANRVEASTDVENLPEQRSLTKAGFTREGVLRGAQFRAGEFHDLVLYSRLRGDPGSGDPDGVI
ncbi:MAG TPA: GNAT family protein, partial [Mycobacteriales bacterium]|nr:GNAT family protein [Mycobacteriales bacterium]